jgi:hypothetical protein
MVDIYEISAVVAAAGVLVGVIYYILDMRHQSRTRETDLIIRLSSTIDNKDFAEALTKILSMDFKDVRELIDTISAPALIMIGNFYERVGALVNRGLVDVGLVHDILIVTPLWEKMKPYVTYCRQKYDDVQLFEWFEYLYNEVKKREQRK